MSERPAARGPAWIAAAVAIGAILYAGPAIAHVSDRGFVMLLPTGHYLAGGGLAVAASFAVLALLPAGVTLSLDRMRLALPRTPAIFREVVNLLAFLGFAALLLSGWWGSRDPLSNPLPLTVWTLLWVGLTLVQGLVGDLWSWISPWRLAGRLLSAISSRPGRPPLRLPERLGYWPALFQFFGFAWFELIDPAPDDPARLATVCTVYFLANLAAMAAFGYDSWARRGECLSAFFGLITRYAVVGRAGAEGHTVLAWPGARLSEAAPLPPSGVLFLLLVLSSVTFDGLSRSFLWLDAIGINPLEYPGRSAVMSANTLGLGLTFLLLAAVFLGAVRFGHLLSGSPATFWPVAGALVWSIVPIALAYHFSHYLTVLMVNGQYALVALSDPFGIGWNLFGTANLQVTPGVALGAEASRMVWNLQVTAIVGGHVLAVIAAHRAAGAFEPPPRRAILAELPLALLMVAYTVFGLWLLSTPTGA
jgi:hypothetical protein